MNKSDLRKLVTAKLYKLEDREEKDRRINDHLKKFFQSSPHKIILSFKPLESEPDITPTNIWISTNAKVYISSLVEENFTDLQNNVVLTDFANVDAILIPGLAFTSKGDRLGRGGGWYDRVLERLPESVVKLGVCYKVQIMEEISTEPHDQRVDVVVTEKGIRD